MADTQSQPTQFDSYEGWVGSGDENTKSWETTNNDFLGITLNGVYLPEKLGPYQSDKEIPIHDFDEYVIKQEYSHNTFRIFLPFVISVVLASSWLFIEGGLGVLLFAAGVLIAMYGVMKVLQERNRDTAHTHVTFHVSQYSTTITLIGDVATEVHTALSQAANNDETETETETETGTETDTETVS